MLRTKIFIGLAVILILLGGMGGFSINKMQSSAEAFERVISRNYDAIKSINQVHLYLSQLDATYLPELTRASEGDSEELVELDLSRDTFDHYYGQVIDNIYIITAVVENEAERRATSDLESALELYFNAFDELFSQTTVARSDVGNLQRRILNASNRVTQLSEKLLSLHEASMSAEQERAMSNSANSKSVLTALIVTATLMAAFLWLQFGRSTLRPLVDLTNSVREIQKRNFELSIPVKSHDEIGELTRAFNDMAAELHLYHRESDERILQLNLESRAILAAFPHPVLLLDDEGFFSQVNPEAENLLQRLGIPDRLPKRVESRYQIARDSGEDYLPTELHQAILLKVDEREFFYLPRIFRIRTETDQSRGWAIVLMDVTRFRWLDDMKTDMLATISHEIKTPLTSIRIVLHMLLEQKIGELNNSQQKAISSARLECENLLKTLETLLDLTRTKSGSAQLNLDPLDPQVLVDEVAPTFQQIASDKGLRLETEIEPDLPKVNVDRIRILQVLKNLLSNALKYSPDGALIRLTVHQLGPNFLRFSVVDEGEGVPEDSQQRIFDPFFQAPGKTSHGGVGLGLSISREIVHAHEGRIGVDSEPSSPTIFYFDLPVYRPSKDQDD